MFALLLALACACGPLPDLGGAEMTACEAVPGAVCVSAEESACGWRRLDVADSSVPGTTNERGDLFMAPPGRCVIAEEYDENGLLTDPGAAPCDVPAVGVRCVILMPGESAASWKRIGSEKLATGLEAAELDGDGGCPLACQDYFDECEDCV